MSIILDLQSEAIDSNSDILSLLRKALLVSRKLGLGEFEYWVNSELNGYNNTDEVPEYRIVDGQLKGWNQLQGWVSVIIPDSELEEVITCRGIINPIPSLNNMLSSSAEKIYLGMPGSIITQISKMTGVETDYSVFISQNSIANIIEQVKNKILDWSLILEEQGIIGDGISFTQAEKDKAHSQPQVINYISNFYGSISNTQIQQGTKKSTQK